MQTILVIGDSLGCPRPWEGVPLAGTYAYGLQQRLGPAYYVVNASVSENSSAKASGSGFLRTYVQGSGAAYVVVQLGIVDCAPRLMSAVERLIGGLAARAPGLRGIYAAYARLKSRNRYRLTKLFPRTLVSLDAYEANLRRLVEAVRAEPNFQKLFFLNTAAPGEFLVERSFGIERNIELYNAALERIAAEAPEQIEIVDVHGATRANPDWITPADGHHITAPAHAFIADALAERIAARGAGAQAAGRSR